MAYQEREQPGVLIYWDTFEMLQQLDSTTRDFLLTGIYNYARYGEDLDLEKGAVKAVWLAIRRGIDRDKESYSVKKQRGRIAGQMSAESREQKKMEAQINKGQHALTAVDYGQLGQPITPSIPSSSTVSATFPSSNTIERVADKPPARHSFVPPSANEVKEFCQQMGYMVDAERFVSFYASKGWMVGRNQMKDWQAAVRNWNSRNEGGAGKNDGTSQIQFAGNIGTVV